MLTNDDWYDIAHDVDWTLSSVDAEEAFPASWSGVGSIPKEAWANWCEPYRVTYRDYVHVQREKETGAYAVRDALKRANIYEKLDPAHTASSQLHMGTTCMVEQMAVTMQSRFVRFAPSPRWRNLGVYGMLDEIRHAQLDLVFSHDLLKHDERFDWCNKAFHTNEWGVLAVKNFFDDWMLNANCVESTIATSLTVEHGFTNMQFVALAADAMEAGDVDFSNLLSSIQTDEARHAQLGFPTLEVLMKHDPKRAQYLFDVSFWRSFRLFQTLTGTSMDYYTPFTSERGSGVRRCFGSPTPECPKPNANGSTRNIRAGTTVGASCGTRSSTTSTAVSWQKPIPRRYRRCATSPSCRWVRRGTDTT
jgi:toluene monooxygenase system protein A